MSFPALSCRHRDIVDVSQKAGKARLKRVKVSELQAHQLCALAQNVEIRSRRGRRLARTSCVRTKEGERLSVRLRPRRSSFGSTGFRAQHRRLFQVQMAGHA